MFKAIIALFISFLISVLVYPKLIPALHRFHFGQTVRDDGPEAHLKKNGTPTMGGICFLLSFVIASVLIQPSHQVIAVLLVTLGFGLIGFVDDYIKVAKHRSLGLRPKQKIAGQLVICIIFIYYLMRTVGTGIYIPFAGTTLQLGIIYIPFALLAILGTVNGVNLTDGLDGLSSGVTIIVVFFFTLCAYASRSNLTVAGGAMIGGLMAYLIFNAYPAKVFMGDTGSLAMGGFVVAVALVLRMPLFILLAGFVYLMESVSVIIQVAVYKKTKKRVFKMAPIHHHFELCGMKETRVVVMLYVIAALSCLVAALGCMSIFA